MTGGAGDAASVDALIADAKLAEDEGFAVYQMANIFSYDAIMALAMAGPQTDRIELMSAVTPTYPRHPHAMAQQALTAQSVSGGRFTLGIGLSHKLIIDDMLGMSFDRPARHMRQYLEVLMPLLHGEPAKVDGDQYRVAAELDVPGGTPVSCITAALGPAMLKVTGELADGTTLWMTGPKTVESHIAPGLRVGTDAAGRPDARLICSLPVLITDDADAGRAQAAEQFALYNSLPSYRGMLDHEGADGPADVALIGGEEEVESQVRRIKDVGATDFCGHLFGDDEQMTRTRAFLAGLGGEL
jgi:F420-dependent oxidoreductase-like protein